MRITRGLLHSHQVLITGGGLLGAAAPDDDGCSEVARTDSIIERLHTDSTSTVPTLRVLVRVLSRRDDLAVHLASPGSRCSSLCGYQYGGSTAHSRVLNVVYERVPFVVRA